MNIVIMFQVWSCDIIVDWADPQEEPDESTMSKVKVLYVRNLTQDTTEEKLKVSWKQWKTSGNSVINHIALLGSIRTTWQDRTSEENQRLRFYSLRRSRLCLCCDEQS